MKNNNLLLAMFFCIAIAACGGGGGGNTGASSATTSNPSRIFGRSAPDSIVGLACWDSANWHTASQVPCTVPAYTVIADANGDYSFSITQAGTYGISASHGGDYSVFGVYCTFTNAIINGNGFNCEYGMPLTSFTYSPTNGFSGVSFHRAVNGMVGIENTASSNGLVSGSFTTGARVVTQGASYEWDDTSGNHSTLSYDSAHGTISVVLVPASTPSGDGVICSVSSNVNVNGTLYYPCSKFGITFNSAAGTITFATTPIYHAVGVWGVAYPYADYAGAAVAASGSLTFPPF